MRKLIVLFALLLSACNSVPEKTVADSSQLAAALSIAPSEILHSDAVAYAVALPNSGYADFNLGMYAQSSTHVYIARYEKTGKLQKAVQIALNGIEYAGLASRGASNHLQQLRIEAKGTVVAVNFNNSTDAEAGYKERTGEATEHLRSQGVDLQRDAPWVIPGHAKEWGQSLPLIVL